MTKIIQMGISGDRGSFSEEAALAYGNNASRSYVYHYLLDMKGVLSALEGGTIDQGFIPVVNTNSGLVRPAFQAMGEYQFRLMDDYWHEVNQCLLVLPGMTLPQIRYVASHEQALAQCKNFLREYLPGVKPMPWVDTAKAARDLVDGLLSRSTAVIASAHAAQLYQLQILKEGIHDQKPNLTAFIIVEAIGALNK